MLKHTLLAGALAVGLTTIGATTAHAEKADFSDTYHDQISFPDVDLSNACGADIWIEIDARGHVKFWDDGRIHAQDHGTATLQNRDNGKFLTQSWAGSFKGIGSETFNEDGTITIAWSETSQGIQQKWVDQDGNILIMDRGQLHSEGSVTIDLEAGTEADFEETITTKGPHPIIESGGLDPAQACAFLN